jgi:hypothetical protein
MIWLSFLACTASPPETSPSDSGTSSATPVDPVRQLPLPQVPLAMAHNAMASEADGYLAPNQALPYEGQLELGVRGFMLDIHDEGQGPELCHNLCALGRAPLAEGLARFAAWLDDHPDELVVFVLQDEVDPPAIIDAFEATGLASRAVVPPKGAEWPSIDTLVSDGTQLLVTTERAHADVPPWYVHAYGGVAFDNDYAAQTVDDFDCEVLRGQAGSPFQLVNHFLTAPTARPDLAEQANTYASLLDHVDRCEAHHDQPVSWLAVDFVSIGEVMAVVDTLAERRLR